MHRDTTISCRYQAQSCRTPEYWSEAARKLGGRLSGAVAQGPGCQRTGAFFNVWLH